MILESKLGQLGWALGSPFDDELSRSAARELLASADPATMLCRLFPVLIEQKVLRAALTHLERAGADLQAFSIPTATICNTFPMSRQRLWPIPPDSQWNFNQLAQTLMRHRQLLWQATLDVARRTGSQRFVLLSGRAMESLFPDYQERLGFDTDLWVPRLSDGLDFMEILIGELGFRVEHAHLKNIGSEPHLVASASRQVDGFKVTVGILGGSYHFFTEPLDQRSSMVQWASQSLRAPSPEDLLVMLAARVQRRQQLQMVNVTDAAFILRHSPCLDFSLVKHLSQKYKMDLPLGILLAQVDARWPGMVPQELKNLVSSVPGIYRSLTRTVLQVRDDNPIRQGERIAFEMAGIRQGRPLTGWLHAAGIVLSGRTTNWFSQWQGKVQNRLGMPPLPTRTDLLKPHFLCGVLDSEKTRLPPHCQGREPASRWGKKAGDEIRQAAERLVLLLPEEGHDCWRLRASHDA